MSQTHRRVLLAKPRGYCAGVDRAVQAVEIALGRFGAPVYVRKQIVHNKHVVSELEKLGAIFVEETDEVPEGSVVVFSAHGIAPRGPRGGGAARADRHRRDLPAGHQGAQRGEALRRDRLTTSCSSATRATRRSSAPPARRPRASTWSTAPAAPAGVEVRDPAKVVWLSQTTLSVDETVQTVAALRERFPQLIDPPSDDICYATQNRQTAVKAIAPLSDVVIVVGSPNSSNSVRLVEVAKDAGARAAYLVDDAGEIDEAWFRDATTVGVTSGASVPEELVAGVLGKLAALGFADVEEIEAVKERMSFQLPRELRK